MVEPSPTPQLVSEQPQSVESAPRTSNGRRKGGSRKGNGRRSAPKQAEVIVLAPPEEVGVADLPIAAVEVVEAAQTPVVPQTDELAPPDSPDGHDVPSEPVHVSPAPLFEPEPFVRMQRQAFGRRGRI